MVTESLPYVVMEETETLPVLLESSSTYGVKKSRALVPTGLISNLSPPHVAWAVPALSELFAHM